MSANQPNATFIPKAVALAVANLVLGVLNVAPVETRVILLGLGLLALALAGLRER